MKASDVPIVRAVKDHVVDVLDGHEAIRREILAIDRSDGDDGLDVEIEVEGQTGVVRVVAQTIEGSRMAHGFAPARVTDQRDVTHVHPTGEGIRVVGVEPLPCLEVLQQEPPSRIVLASDPSIHEIHVDGRQDIPAAGQQLP